MKHGQFVLFTIAPMSHTAGEWGMDEDEMNVVRKFDRRVCRVIELSGEVATVELVGNQRLEMVHSVHLHEFPIPDVHFDIQKMLYETGMVLPVGVSPNDIFDAWCQYEGLINYGSTIRKMQWAGVSLVDWLPGRKKTEVDEAFLPAVHGTISGRLTTAESNVVLHNVPAKLK
jgi:hypothetical protein